MPQARVIVESKRFLDIKDREAAAARFMEGFLDVLDQSYPFARSLEVTPPGSRQSPNRLPP
jgi:hypothetical protein